MGQLIFWTALTVIAVLVAKWFINHDGHPKALFYLFFAEMWERFSFYGMRALLVLYIIKDYMESVENNEEIAYGIYAAYGALVYATPLLGGFIADRFIGYRKAIMLGGVLMAIGHFFMAFPTDVFFYGALGLLIAGNGFFKPNISSLVGALYKEGDIKRDSGFTIFYMGINLGAAAAPFICGYIGEMWGWHYGFSLAGLGMLAGVIVFWDGLKKGVFGDKGLQPQEYVDKKFFNLNIDKLVWVFGFLIVPIFAYLIVLEADGNNFLGMIINLLLFISVGYAGYLMLEHFSKIGEAVKNTTSICIITLGSIITTYLIWPLASTNIPNLILQGDLVDVGSADVGLVGFLLGFLLAFVTIVIIAFGGFALYTIFLSFKNINNEKAVGANQIGAILILAVLCAIFWACFEQAGSSLTVWADKCVNLGMFTASQTNGINPAIIILAAFPFALLWQKLDLWGRNPNTPKKFALGLAFLGLGFLAFAYSIHFISDAGKLPFGTLIIGWLLITTGELCLSPIGLSKVTQLSPKKSNRLFYGTMVSIINSCPLHCGYVSKTNNQWRNN